MDSDHEVYMKMLRHINFANFAIFKKKQREIEVSRKFAGANIKWRYMLAINLIITL